MAALVFVLGSCGERVREKPIVLPASPILSRDFIGYGVIIVSYTHVLDQPRSGAPSQGYVRRGSIVRVLERLLVRTNGEGVPWVFVEGVYRGWLEESNIQIYDNESRAKTAAELLS
ncbi:MAG: hypothetical protein LBK64_05400 [Spirochaetaceae bacterium]|nr:hypothetical protein [Spirochaetaceae bacterium]